MSHYKTATYFLIRSLNHQVTSSKSHSCFYLSSPISTSWMFPCSDAALHDGRKEKPSRSFKHFKPHFTIKNSIKWWPLHREAQMACINIACHAYSKWKGVKCYLRLWYVVMNTAPGEFSSRKVTVANRSSKSADGKVNAMKINWPSNILTHTCTSNLLNTVEH
jgi:hypothetical protein